MIMSAQFTAGAQAFPQKAVEGCITSALDDQAGTQAILHGSSASGSWEPEIDSLVVVEIICAIEEQLGLNLPQSFIPRGGYSRKADCISDLVGQAKAVWDANVVSEKVHA